MVEICPKMLDIVLREMAENSLKIDPHNANPFIVLVYRLIDERVHQQNPLVEEMVARISKIDPTSPYAPYLFYFLSFYCTIDTITYREAGGTKVQKSTNTRLFLFLEISI